MNLSTIAAQVTSAALEGKVEDALAVAERGLVEGTGASPSEQSALWHAIASVELIRGSMPGVLTAAERCVSLAVESDNAGWASCGLSIRAIALARQGRMEPALLDLARAEAELDACDSLGLRCWAHMGLGYSYLELRLYELARPHLEEAVRLEASPVPMPEGPVLALRNLAELHVRWADELERVDGSLNPDESQERAETHRTTAHGHAQEALARARVLDQPLLVANCRAMELNSRPGGNDEDTLTELRELFDDDNPVDFQGARSVTGTALARALRATGEIEEAVEVARRAVVYAEAAGDWQVSASAQWLLVEIESDAGLPGAADGRTYASLLSQVLWQQRLSTLQGAHAALQLERVHRDKEIAQRAASEDSLTGVGNRRALDDSLRALQAEDALVGPNQSEIGSPLSLLMVDLDDFKQINDTYGHVVGDDVLRAVAMAIRGVARSDDVVARVGGDEFVILARGADREAGEHLAERVTAAVDALAVGTRSGAITLHASVGVATADSGTEAALLLAEADEAMYAVKGPPRQRSGSVDDFPRPRRPLG